MKLNNAPTNVEDFRLLFSMTKQTFCGVQKH